MDDKLRPCFQCGLQPLTVEYGSAIEIAGRCEQYGVIRCSGEKLTGCPVEIIISFDSDYPVGDRIDQTLKAAWDVLNSSSTNSQPEIEMELNLLALIAKSPSWKDIKVPEGLETNEQFANWLSAQRDKPRITEDDAREIAESLLRVIYPVKVTFTEKALINKWMEVSGRELLDKLNEVK